MFAFEEAHKQSIIHPGHFPGPPIRDRKRLGSRVQTLLYLAFFFFYSFSPLLGSSDPSSVSNSSWTIGAAGLSGRKKQ
jgi:hypothetical protein